MATIDLRFINDADGTDARDVEGYQFADFFSDDGLERAEKAKSVKEAWNILLTTYKGADTEGIGVLFAAVSSD